jgi:hypothetical protein
LIRIIGVDVQIGVDVCLEDGAIEGNATQFHVLSQSAKSKIKYEKGQQLEVSNEYHDHHELRIQYIDNSK